MKIFHAFLVFLIVTKFSVFGQIEPSIIYDVETGDYVIQYQGYTDTVYQLIFEPSNKIEPFISAKVLQNNSSYTYCYSIYNSIFSAQRLEDFDLELFSPIENISQPDGFWKHSWYSFVPVFGWYNSKGEGGINHPLNGIAPDSSASDFSYISQGLPTIVRSFSKGKATTVLAFPEEPPIDIELLLRPLTEFPNNTVIRFSIGPKNPPHPFIPNEFLDTLIYYNQRSYELGWITDEQTYNKYNSLFINARDTLIQLDTITARIYLQDVLREVDIDSFSTLTSEAYALLRHNTEYLLEQLPEPTPTEPIVKFINSVGSPLTGGVCQYYEGGWKTATDNGDGTFSIETDKTTLRIRMTYAYGTQTLSNVPWGTGPVVFQTVNAQVQLKDSQGNFIDEGTVKYYAGGWRDFGVTENGIASKELLPNNYSFRITYAYASTDKQQDMGDNPTVVFQTVPATVQLKDSQDNLIDEGIVKYYAGGWRDFGSASSGVAVKELLPNNYSFRMTYAYASNDKQQNLNDNTTVVFQTVLAAVQLKNSQGGLIDQGVVQYYSGGWRTFGTTANGVTTKELLPNNYSFRMAYAFASNDKQQNLNDNTTVIFQTVLAAVQLKNSTGAFIDQGTVQYYSGGWRNFGTTTNGVATLELLPNNYSFRMTYAFASNDKQQNIGNDPAVIFQTVPATVQLKDSQSNLIDAGSVQYYSGGWRTFGTTNNGIATLELLPNNYSFRMTHEYISNDKAQNVGVNNIVEFSTVNCIIRVNNQQTQPIDGAIISYYSGGWRQIGSTVNGEITKELLPRSLTFRATYAVTSQDKTQDTSTNNIIEFVIAQ